MHDSRSQGLGSSSGRIIMLCSSVRHSASTQEYKWLPAKYHLKKCRLVKNGGGGGGFDPQRTSIPFRGSSSARIRFMLQYPA